MKSTYRTIERSGEGIYKEKGSKFLAFAFPVYQLIEVKLHLDELKKKHYNAKHHCYAYRLGIDKNIFKVNDDAEPANTAGKHIFGQIESNDLTNILIIVVRYFGGTLLGKGGLIKAYRTAAYEAINNTRIVIKEINDVYQISFAYNDMKYVMRILKEEKVSIINKSFEVNSRIKFRIKQCLASSIVERLKRLETVKIEYLYTE